jgi:hypothetical protein
MVQTLRVFARERERLSCAAREFTKVVQAGAGPRSQAGRSGLAIDRVGRR